MSENLQDLGAEVLLSMIDRSDPMVAAVCYHLERQMEETLVKEKTIFLIEQQLQTMGIELEIEYHDN